MNMVFSVYAAMTLGLLVLQLRDYLVGSDRVPFTEHKMMATVTRLPGVAPHPMPAPAAQYDRAA
jgi:hypothetical protein